MGADLTIIYFAVPKTIGTNPQKLDELRQQMLKKVDELKEDDFDEELLDYFNSTPEETDELKEEFRSTINELFDYLFGREVTWIEHKDEIIYITGGMSYGDNPTEMYGVFERILNMPTPIRNLVN